MQQVTSPVSETAPMPAVTEIQTEEASLPAEEEESGELAFGAHGDSVVRLQTRLIQLGYLAREVPDDFYDIEVEGAVKVFQKAVGLEPTGIASIATLSRLFEWTAPKKDEAFPPVDPMNPGAAGMDVTLGAEYEGSLTAGSAAPSASVRETHSMLRIGLDPGHQARGNSEKEPSAPGSDQTKAKVTSGTEGRVTGVAEHAVNLAVALKVRDLLQAQGVEVVMTRETADVDISNKERAQMMNEADVDLVVRIHCDGEEDTSRHGAFILVPAGSYTTAVQAESKAAAEDVLQAFIAATGAKNLGLSERSDQTGFNWSTVPVINIEMGHMSNADEDRLLADNNYQTKCAQGIAQGILQHFAEKASAST